MKSENKKGRKQGAVTDPKKHSGEEELAAEQLKDVAGGRAAVDSALGSIFAAAKKKKR